MAHRLEKVIQIVSYTYMRKHLSEIMEKIANGEQIFVTRKGQEPFIIAKVGTPTEAQLEKSKHEKRTQAIQKLNERHTTTIKTLANK